MIAESIDRDQPIPPLTQRETAKVMTMRGYPMSKSRVKFIEDRALRKLAEKLADLGCEAESKGGWFC